MGAPVRESDDSEPSKNEPLRSEAPKIESLKRESLKGESFKRESSKPEPLKPEWLKNESSKNLTSKKKAGVVPSGRATEAPEPLWKRKTRRGVFEGDVAVVELRSRLAFAPERVPEPAAPVSNAPTFAALRLMGSILTAAAVAGVTGYLWGFRLSTESPQRAPASNQANMRPSLSTAATNLNALPPDPEPLPEVSAKSRPFAPASNQTNAVPTPPSPAANLKAANTDAERPSRGAVTIGPASVDTRGATNNVTSVDIIDQLMPLATGPRPVSPSSASRSPPSATDASEIAAKMKIGTDLMANGDITAARMMFERAAEAGNATGAFALAETYDPAVLGRLRLRGGIAPDVALARKWYEKARDLGSIAAPERISRLAQIPQ
jgi:hypothetical protein